MYLDLFESKTLNAIEGYVDRLAQRHKVIASNIANIDTPGYKTKDITFNATMKEVLASRKEVAKMRMTNERHISAAPLPPMDMTYEPEGLLERADRNNVDIDREMKNLNETTFAYSMMTHLLRGRYQKLTTSINEGRGGQ